MITLRLPLQTTTGIVDPAAWFMCSTHLVEMSKQLLLALVNYGHEMPDASANCQTYVDAYQEVFGDRFGLSVQSGYFGLPSVHDGQVVFYKHAWLVAASARGWVIDMVPFNGFMSPLIINASLPPWVGLYRPMPPGTRLSQSENQVRFRHFLVGLLRYLDDQVSIRQLE